MPTSRSFTLTDAERKTILAALDVALDNYHAYARTAPDEDVRFNWECRARELGALLDCMSDATILCNG